MRNKMYTYQMEQRIPTDIEKEIMDKLDIKEDCSKYLIPTKKKCSFCSEALGNPVLITQKAKVITMSGSAEGICTYYKRCPSCNVPYSYNDINHMGIYNYNDNILMSPKLRIFVRNFLQINTTPSRAL